MNDAPTQSFTGDEDIQRLYAALSWEAGGRRRRSGLMYSLIVHGAAFLPLLLSSITLPAKSPQQPPAIVSQLVFLPKASSIQPRAPSTPNPLTTPSLTTPIDDSEGASTQLKVELTGIYLGFERDHVLPALVQRKHGDLALKQKGDQDFAEYLFSGSDWRLKRGPVNIRDRYVVLMDPPEAWQIFRELERREGIPPGKFEGAALFDIVYRFCIAKAIREAAFSSHKSIGAVISAQLKFTLDVPCGVVGLGVELAPKAER